MTNFRKIMLVSLASFTSLISAYAAPSGDASWRFDDNSNADLVVYDKPSNSWYIKSLQRNGNTNIVFKFQWGFDGGIPLTGDFDGDGVGDVCVYNPRSGEWFIRSLNGSVIAWKYQWGYDGVIPLVGDFNGDGKDDIAVYDTNLNLWYARGLNGSVFSWALRWGYKDAVPVVLDVDGGGDDLGIFKDGVWDIIEPGGAIVYTKRLWGFPGSIPVPADFDGDGNDEFGVYGVDDGKWYAMKRNGVAVVWGVQHGYAGVAPVARDFDGDSKADLGVFDVTKGEWFIRKTSGSNPNLAWGEKFGSKNATPPDVPEVEQGFDIGVKGSGGGFIWKPISEGDHKLVVLLPRAYKGKVKKDGCYIADSNGKPIATGRFSGDTHNGGRPHFRFGQKGAAYGQNVYVVATLNDGRRHHWFIRNGASRTVY